MKKYLESLTEDILKLNNIKTVNLIQDVNKEWDPRLGVINYDGEETIIDGDENIIEFISGLKKIEGIL